MDIYYHDNKKITILEFIDRAVYSKSTADHIIKNSKL